MTILLADIGGTHARFSCLKSNKMTPLIKVNCGDFKTPLELIEKFFVSEKIQGIYLSVAGPVYKGKVQWTNRPKWQLSESELKRTFKVKKVLIINDMVAQAHGLKLPERQKALLMNVGTGMGTSLILNGCIYPCEFGLVLDEKKRKKEYLLSGQGVLRIYHDLGGKKEVCSAKLLDEMRQNKDKHAIKAYQKFYELWGKIAGNIATGLMLNRIYLWGGLVPKNKKDLKDFLKTFHDKKLPKFNQKIQVKIVREKSLAIKGLRNLSMNKFSQS